MPRHLGTHRFDGLKIGQQNIQPVLDGYRNSTSPVIDGYARDSTKEPLTFFVDYNLAGAVRTPGFTIVRQREIDGYLSAAGTTAFQYLQDVWDVLPTYISHNITINIARGVHRPRNPEPNGSAWTLSNKQTMGAAIIVLQGSYDGYTVIDPFKSITAVQAASNDPFVDVTGSPYVADGYRGFYALFSTGQISVIHDNTTNRLSVTNNISPAAPTSVAVIRPGTILRNSYNDAASVKSTGFSIGGGNNTICRVSVQDIQFDPFNPTFAFTTSLGAIVTVTRCTIDHAFVKDNFGISDGGRGYQPSDSLTISTSSMRGTNIAAVPTVASGDALFFSVAARAVSFTNCYVGGFRRLLVTGGTSSGESGINVSSTIFDKMWQYGWFFQNGVKIFAQHNSTGPYTTFRDTGGYSIYLQRNCAFSPGTTQAVDIKFEGAGNGFPFIFLEQGNTCIIENGIGFQTGASDSSDVGIQLSGPFNKVILNSSTNVSGTNGDVKFADGSIRSYAAINTGGPFIDSFLNFVQKT